MNRKDMHIASKLGIQDRKQVKSMRKKLMLGVITVGIITALLFLNFVENEPPKNVEVTGSKVKSSIGAEKKLAVLQASKPLKGSLVKQSSNSESSEQIIETSEKELKVLIQQYNVNLDDIDERAVIERQAELVSESYKKEVLAKVKEMSKEQPHQ